MKLRGKVALVTGANRGIGYEVCRMLGEEGADVILSGRNPEKVEAAADKLRFGGLSITSAILDLSDTASIHSFLRNLQQPVDILINNAAILDQGRSIQDLTEETLQQVIHTNLIGPILLTKYLCKSMADRHWGRIVNVSSGMGSISKGMGPDSMAYRISKLALNGFTRCLAELLKGTGVLVNSVDPGWVQTAMGGPGATRTVEQGARGILWAVLIPDNGPSGSFFRDGKKIDW